MQQQLSFIHLKTTVMKKTLLFTSILMLVVLFSVQAQKKTLSGQVIDADGNPVPVATIVVSGTTNGTTADVNGQFTLETEAGAQLEVSSIGFKTKTVTVPADNSSLTITLQSSARSLDEMVVTALGIKRKKRALGYSSQQVSGEELAAIKNPNLTNDLTGKIAGLQVVRGGGGITGSSKIVLRGYNSLTGDNQPLIVVDGIPFSNFSGRANGNNDFWNPTEDMGNGLSDIDPSNIESINVLKGPSAAALYGSRAGNGVILITTKSGQKSKGLGIHISSSIGFQSIFTRPEKQTIFGQGTLGNFDKTTNLSWGPKIEGQEYTRWDGKKVPMKAYDNAKTFFRTGVLSNQSISFSQKYGGTGIYTSYNRMDNKGLTPGTKLGRNNLMAKINSNFGPDKKWTLSTKVQFINSTAHNRPRTGFAREVGMPYYDVYNLPVNVDLANFKDPTDEDGNMIWYLPGNAHNPFWTTMYDLNEDTRNRFLMYGSLQYDFTDWLNARIKGGADMYTRNTSARVYAGSPQNNSYSVGKNVFQETNYSFLITAQKDNLFGEFGANFSFGGNLMDRKKSNINGSATELEVPNLFALGNNAGGKPDVGYGESHKRINSLYATLELNYGGYLFLTGTFRNDWSSALSKANRSYSYPSVALSYIFSDMILSNGGVLPSWLTYGKARISYAAVGNDLPPYQLYNTYGIGKDPFGNTSAWRGSTLYNPNVRSELIKSLEVGVNLRFFDSRLGLDLTYYKSNATRQLINLPMDPLSGYSSKKINAGNIQNEGIEVMLDGQIIKNRNNGFNWDISANLAMNKNKIIALAEGVDKYQLGGFDVISVNAVTGKNYGEIYGRKFLRVEDENSPYYGELILNNGLPQMTSEPYDLGNQQPDAILGFTTNFSYKHFGLSVSVDGSFGGKMFSSTLVAMQQRGTAAVTVVNGRRDSIFVAGVYDAGENDYKKNTTKVSAQNYWQNGIGVSNTGITEANLYDATNVRIRNIQLSYSVPRNILANSPFQQASLSVSCNNVLMLTSHMHGLDPESTFASGSNATGYESGSAPTLRTFYITLNLGF